MRPRSEPSGSSAEGSTIRLEGLGKTYEDGTVAVQSLDLDVPAGKLVCLVGPSGCGKSTTLKMVNRLIEPTTGRILIDGRDITGEDPVKLRRGIGYVIQQVGLFPHQDIATNVATVPSLLGWDRRRARERALELLDLVGLDPATFAKRYPHQLSGGQRQRVGVARALAADPPVLLMDEPFGAVDPVVRGRLQDQFLHIQRDLGKTVLMVTHDIDEAVKMGDKVAVFAVGGRLAQYDVPAAVLGAPADDFVAEFVGSARGMRRLAVTPIDPAHLEPLDGINAADLAGTVDVGSTLEDAMALLMREDKDMVGITDGARFLGVLTPNGIHRMLRADVNRGA
ncbi:MAG: ATP-binding cassette domain-containing protein [Nocardioidaceae bacterium]|nr:ATP-binding cassette domain-containing protein [Nocardioidaceae bacterium]